MTREQLSGLLGLLDLRQLSPDFLEHRLLRHPVIRSTLDPLTLTTMTQMAAGASESQSWMQVGQGGREALSRLCMYRRYGRAVRIVSTVTHTHYMRDRASGQPPPLPSLSRHVSGGVPGS